MVQQRNKKSPWSPSYPPRWQLSTPQRPHLSTEPRTKQHPLTVSMRITKISPVYSVFVLHYIHYSIKPLRSVKKAVDSPAPLPKTTALHHSRLNKLYIQAQSHLCEITTKPLSDNKRLDILLNGFIYTCTLVVTLKLRLTKKPCFETLGALPQIKLPGKQS